MKLKDIKPNTLRGKLIALIFITLIPLTILQAYNIVKNYQLSMEAELKSSEEYAEAYSSAFMSYLENIWKTQSAVGLSIISNLSWSEDDIEKFMNDVINNGISSPGFSWVSPEGIVLVSTYGALKGRDLSDREYIRQIAGGIEKSVSGLRFNEKNEAFIPVARGIRYDGKLYGIVVSTISEKDFDTIFAAKRSGASGSYGLIDKNGMIVYSSGGSPLTPEKRMLNPDSPAWKALAGQVERVYGYNASVNGKRRMGVSYPIKPIGWACFVTRDVGELLRLHAAIIKKNVVILVVIYIVSFFTASLFGYRFFKSVNKVINVTKDIINGNSKAKTGLTGNDEIATVGQAIDNLTEKINDRISVIEEYNNLKSLFLATMSHELKTPLNIILGGVQLIEKLKTNDVPQYIKSVNKYNKMLKQNSYRLLRLINNLIDINKLEANSIIMNPVNGDIVKMIEDITQSVVEYTNSKGIALTFDTEIEEKIMAFDPDKLERIMLNLLSNAIKFTDEGGRIEVNLYDRVNNVIISVKDNGIGIPGEKQSTIFDLFTQVDNSFTRKSEGSGIGLSLVKYLVEMHGGVISVCSELGKGSEFIIRLPVTLVEKAERSCVQDDINIEKVHIEFSDIYN